MKFPIDYPLSAFRKIYTLFYPNANLTGRNWRMFSNKQYANDLIHSYLTKDEPCMIGRLGANELNVLVNFLGVKNQKKNYMSFIRGNAPHWWWNTSILRNFSNVAGFFPLEIGKIEKFCELMIADMPEVDILGSWLYEETFFAKTLMNSKKVVLEDLEPFFVQRPWTTALEGKKVLVIHPFSETITQQYEKRELLFENNLLPAFELKTVKAVLSLAGEKTHHEDWFAALEWMKAEIDEVDFDIAIIGCGAYGFPLAAHVKRNGKKAIHLAGATQLLFGIKGKRWEEFIVWPYTNLFNPHWTRPGQQEKPVNVSVVEDACYW